ncbi:hypothetical protein TUMEXPCC7403_01685 [Tumidithrix helvetica PCC 7403]|uniref:hypothetical protein n=1 Tax=Tumidithrix helvetica TaxID=3457545 RepID=UPI003CAFBF2B
MRNNELDLQILDLVAFNRDQIGILPQVLPQYEISVLLNKLDVFFQRGDLLAKRVENDSVIEKTTLFIPNRQEIEMALTGEILLWYELTNQGGNMWETLLQPNWHFYLCIESESEIESGSLDILAEFITFQFAHPFKTISCDSINIIYLQPWEVSYWKNLPLGYKLFYGSDKASNHYQEDPIKEGAFGALFSNWQDKVNTCFRDRKRIYEPYPRSTILIK